MDRKITMSHIRAVNRAAGQHWFEAGSMRFFKSRVHPTVYGGRYFITSEQGPNGIRAYSIREAVDWGKRIDTVGEFQGYATKSDAVLAVRKLID